MTLLKRHRLGGWGIVNTPDDLGKEIEASLATGADHVRLLIDHSISYGVLEQLKQLVPGTQEIGFKGGYVSVVVCPTGLPE
ncbi:MAG: hypothetical protein UX31_C0010G0032 [Candidatus Nomurabacteria bacterium GW2011_GWA1_46_11]|uniref:Uncharacterized protein n=2 Tax=Parcubacteria group TaxID=1794811 RepID=A0A1G1YUW8_9BACT|nr:MAG: hypothetical protein UX29_C0008G0006 [Parcubacteria group bacterium GW2011_GWA2_46_10]KKU21901.1 MAG: hypothetical protein UX31_C0010G0032 [Candidatus Nomurabacteria bacterium GW2011_GWA1_46_11]OGY56165.1 MAG: hypothetical protein A2119_00845 [Candidatus Colwellbacteria bacterium GWA2_46_10]